MRVAPVLLFVWSFSCVAGQSEIAIDKSTEVPRITVQTGMVAPIDGFTFGNQSERIMELCALGIQAYEEHQQKQLLDYYRNEIYKKCLVSSGAII